MNLHELMMHAKQPLTEVVCPLCQRHWAGQSALVKRIQDLEDENTRLRAALEFYADKKNYIAEGWERGDDGYLINEPVMHDKGQRARDALKGNSS